MGNHLLAPGEEFDFEKHLSDRTEENGWKGAVGIEDGEYVEGILGGGICQVSTTLFNAALLAGLEITERWNHTLFIDHYPAGLDATVTGGGAPKNLRFVNNTPGYIWIYSESDGVDTTFIIFGTDDGREVRYDVLGPYDVIEVGRGAVSTVVDPDLPFDSTTVVFPGQDEMRYRVTRYISWPDGSTTTDTFLSHWRRKIKVVAVPTSTTTATTVPPNLTTTTTTGGG